MVNRVFRGGEAAVATIDVADPASDELLTALRAIPHVLGVSVVTLGESAQHSREQRPSLPRAGRPAGVGPADGHRHVRLARRVGCRAVGSSSTPRRTTSRPSRSTSTARAVGTRRTPAWWATSPCRRSQTAGFAGTRRSTATGRGPVVAPRDDAGPTGPRHAAASCGSGLHADDRGGPAHPAAAGLRWPPRSSADRVARWPRGPRTRLVRSSPQPTSTSPTATTGRRPPSRSGGSAGKPADAGLLGVIHPLDGLQLSAFHRRLSGPCPWRTSSACCPRTSRSGPLRPSGTDERDDRAVRRAPLVRAELPGTSRRRSLGPRRHDPPDPGPRPPGPAPARPGLHRRDHPRPGRPSTSSPSGATSTVVPCSRSRRLLPTRSSGVADGGEVMPPKTTYFEPKPCDGIFLRP